MRASTYLPLWQKIILCIGNNPDKTSRKITEQIKTSESYFSIITNELQKKGIIKKTPDKEYKIIKKYNLTNKGTKIYEQIKKIMEEMKEVNKK